MHDDHSVRAEWILPSTNMTKPIVNVSNFPCNVPGTGCNDSLYMGPPACGCDDLLPLPSDDPKYSCKNCINEWNPRPPPSNTNIKNDNGIFKMILKVYLKLKALVF